MLIVSWLSLALSKCVANFASLTDICSIFWMDWFATINFWTLIIGIFKFVATVDICAPNANAADSWIISFFFEINGCGQKIILKYAELSGNSKKDSDE